MAKDLKASRNVPASYVPRIDIGAIGAEKEGVVGECVYTG
jgi:hypothetical protein